MSPILFTLYIDILLERLCKSYRGCYFGKRFCGAFGYADDLIILSPTICSLNNMLQICSEYSTEYKFVFNPTKSKIMTFHCNDRKLSIPKIKLMNCVIEEVEYDKHLENYVGKISQKDLLSFIGTNDFFTRVDMVNSHFKGLPVDVAYHLFKCFCMPLYGSQTPFKFNDY